MAGSRDKFNAQRRIGGAAIVAAVLILLIGMRTIASYVLEYHWWQEMGQLGTWFNMILYGVSPVIAAALLCFVVLWVAHARAMKFADVRLRDFPSYAKLATLGILGISTVLALISIDTWTVVRYFGGRSLPPGAAAWQDPVFGHTLRFYFFELPFYSVLLHLALGLSFVAVVLYWLTARFWQLRFRIPTDWQHQIEFDFRDLRLSGASNSMFLRSVGAILLLALAARFYLSRFAMLFDDHTFLVGVDYVSQNVTLPLQWLVIAGFALSAVLVLMGQFKPLLALPVLLLVHALVPNLVNSFYVRPSEISIQKPYIDRHIQATRSAFGLEGRAREIEFPARLEARIDPTKHRALLDNVRLWDWRAFHDTVTQIQALRPYYVFADSDVDRYMIDGQIRQVMLTPRELDVRQLGDSRTRWINSQFIYTHGYGLVVAEANRITAEGLPVTLIQDAPAQVLTPDLKLTRPEIYYGEVTHDPVYVRTAQPEFDYPAGASNQHTRYAGSGGFPIDSFPMRFAAAAARNDWNILLTTYLTPESRMMIRRNIKERLRSLAGFLAFDADPYLVLTDEGRLVWIVDAYTTSSVHPYSRAIQIRGIGEVNYIRNSVKATIDAYDGNINLYIFDPNDPIIQAYQRLFPQLLKPESEMPEDLRAHARYPELLFRAQAEVYRTYHMLDPEAFYNREDIWDIARNVYGNGTRPEPVTPTYVIATVPGETEPEFLLMIPFTPRNKDNMIGLMVARCDGETLGELVFLQLSKQELILGPMQIEARINQDQIIAKDLSLWNQQGSQVLRGQMLVLPVEDTFLYIEPIYIQAAEARMPQLKKVAMAMGNTLIYTDTYEQAVEQLGRIRSTGGRDAAPALVIVDSETAGAPEAPAAAPSPPRPSSAEIEAVRRHLRRYRELSSQGKWAEAGRELEALENLVQSR
ncbi:MAG: UPF0182 family protein [Bryobacteraceae bacterium]